MTVNSISGGKTSSYIAANYKADYNVFALVRTNDINCKYPDEKLRQYVSDKIGKEFIGTLEMDDIIKTIVDLEQFIGSEITWVSGKTFDDIIVKPSGKIYLPNPTQRFCTTEMKLRPIFDWWYKNINDPIEQRIGFRANETKRAKRMIEKTNEDGFVSFKGIIGKHKNGNNKWKEIAWQKPSFPLIDDQIFKDNVEEFWKGKPVRFAYMNNCVGCFHRNPILLKHMSQKESNKFQWFVNQESTSYENRTWRKEFKYSKVLESNLQFDLFDDDFNECDSGYCGL